MRKFLPLVAALIVACTQVVAQPTTTPPPASTALQPTTPPGQPQAIARIRNGTNEEIGTAMFYQEPDGIRLDVDVTNLPPGAHGIHVHAVGRCDPPDFTTAGAHFNPTQREHGLDNPNGPHAGDLPNLDVGANGTGRLTATTDRITLGAGLTSVFDADGSSLVIHAQPDDQRTDPAGNSGARIACGVIEAH